MFKAIFVAEPFPKVNDVRVGDVGSDIHTWRNLRDRPTVDRDFERGQCIKNLLITGLHDGGLTNGAGEVVLRILGVHAQTCSHVFRVDLLITAN